MRNVIATGLAGIGFLVLAASAQAAPIVNTGFEDGLAGWTVFSDSDVGAIGGLGAIDAPEGSLMAYIDTARSFSSLKQVFDALTEELVYVVKFLTNERTPSDINDTFTVIGSTGVLLTLDTNAVFGPGTVGFNEQTAFVTVVIPVGTTSLEFLIEGATDHGGLSAALIDLQGEPTPGGDVPEPATLGLVGLGLLGLAAARRRRAA